MADGRQDRDMKAPAFSYIKPLTIEACLDLLASHGEDAQIIAGGQSLMPLLNLRLAAPAVLIDINDIPALRGITQDTDHVSIGALERHADIASSVAVQQALPLLVEAAPHIAHVAIRARGTIGGSLALADPAAEWPACCLALNAEIELASTRGVRHVAAEDFFQGIYETARQPDELLTAIRFPVSNDMSDAVHFFDEIARRRGDFAIAGLALTCRRRGLTLTGVHLALFGVADRPILAKGAMAAIEGHELGRQLVGAATAALSAELEPPEDPAYPSDYRRRVACILLKRALGKLQPEQVHAA
jgi:carbon-monoxide dehydrogenase medium subunit